MQESKNSSDSLPFVEEVDEAPIEAIPQGCDSESCNTAIVPDIDPKLSNTSFFQTLMHLIKSNIGAGILNLPIAMSKAGVLFGPVALVLFAIPVLHCMEMLLDASREVSKRYRKRKAGFAGTAKYAFLPYLGRYSSIPCYIVNSLLIFTQLGVCSACLLFASETVHVISNDYFSKRIWILIVSATMIPFALIKSLKTLSVLSMLANILCLSGLIGTIVGIMSHIKSPSNYPMFVGGINTLLFFTSLTYAYEGIAAVLPLYNEMKTKRNFVLSLRISMFIVMFFFIVIGWLGYIAFGNSLSGSLSLSLPDTAGYNIVKVLYAQGVYLSLFLQIYVALSIIVPSIKNRINSKIGRIAYEYGMTYVLLGSAVLLIQTVPKLDNVINLIGSVSCASLCFIMPAMIHTAVFLKAEADVRQSHLSPVKIAKNVFLIIFGMVLCIAGFYSTLTEILKDSGKS